MNKQQITGLLRRFYAGDQKALEELYRLTGKFAFFQALCQYLGWDSLKSRPITDFRAFFTLDST